MFFDPAGDFERWRFPHPDVVFAVMNAPERVLLFTIEGDRFALPLGVVEHVVHAVAITELPGAPEIVLGIIDVHGEIVPVINMRRRLGLPEREIELTDQIILARAGKKVVALLADQVGDVTFLPPGALIDAESIARHADFVDGVLKIGDGLALLQDLEKFLSVDERQAMEGALATREQETLIGPHGAAH